MRYIIKLFLISMLFLLGSCVKYLDIVPDNIATIDDAFTMRSTAKKYLATCYSYLPKLSVPFSGNPSMLTGDEIWFYSYITFPRSAWEIALGNQNIVDPFVNYWDGRQNGMPYFTAIRDCNIFLENIYNVPDLDLFEKDRWAGEVKFLKAFYHFWLLRMYGPIPLIRTNLPISSDVDQVKVYREPVDNGFEYIVQLLDEAIKDLPNVIPSEVDEMGRITRPIALAFKAKVLVTAASPFFNGNTDYPDFIGPEAKGAVNVAFFNQQYDPNKWNAALEACREALESCREAGFSLFYFTPQIGGGALSDLTTTEISIRGAITERWNSEVIWAQSDSRANSLQAHSMPRVYSDEGHFGATQSTYAPTMKMAELFYTKNGVPIDEDKTWTYRDRFELKEATNDDRLFIKPGNKAPLLHFDREPRFYADLGFDGGRWYGQGRFEDNDNFYIAAKSGDVAANHATKLSITGYWPKKLVNYKNLATPQGFSIGTYPWPIIRVADLYLLMAEASNEVNGPIEETFHWINLVRDRAGLKPVQDAWSEFSLKPAKFQSREGLREIIHQERLIELAFEGQRYWDLRRWKEAERVLTAPIIGWNLEGTDAESYFKPRVLFNQEFRKRDYLWPLREETIIINRNLVQNPGW